MSHDPDSLHGRLVAALVAPGVKGNGSPLLVASQGPLAVVEWPDQGKGLVLVAHRPGEDELQARLARIIDAHQGGLLFVAVVGGGDEVVGIMRAADREAHDPDRLGLYHLDRDGRLTRVVGRRLREIEAATRAIDRVQPLAPENVPAAIERGRVQRAEAVAFSQSLSRRLPRVTVALLAVCFLLFALASGAGGGAGSLHARLGLEVLAVARGEPWRLLTYAFLHFGAVHLLVNMVALYGLGSFLEGLVGWTRYLGIFCASALGGGMASAVAGLVRMHLGWGPVLTVGASGAIWGLMGATLGLVLRRERVFPELIARGLRQRLVVVLLLNVGISFLPGIDLFAHLGGGLTGFLLVRGGKLHPAAAAPV
jgi:membrane associated rhomboid family serine protease